MAVTVVQLAQALRIQTSSDEPAEPFLGILTRLLGVGEALSDLFAPDAPTAIRDEATIRVAGYLYDQPNASNRSGYASAWANSGAAALVAPWQRRRPVAIEAAVAQAAVAAGIDEAAVKELIRQFVIGPVLASDDLGTPGEVLTVLPGGSVAAWREPGSVAGEPSSRVFRHFSHHAVLGPAVTEPVAIAADGSLTWRLLPAFESDDGVEADDPFYSIYEGVLWFSFDAAVSAALTITARHVFLPTGAQLEFVSPGRTVRTYGTPLPPIPGAGAFPIGFPLTRFNSIVCLSIGDVFMANTGPVTITKELLEGGIRIELDATLELYNPQGDTRAAANLTAVTAENTAVTFQQIRSRVTGLLPAASSVGLDLLAPETLARMAPALTGKGGMFLAVKSDGSEVEIVPAPAGSGLPADSSITLAKLADEVLARIAPALTGNGGKYLAVKSDASAVELVAGPAASITDGSITLDKLAAAVLARMAPALTGNGGMYLAVNSAGDAVELVSGPSAAITDGSITLAKLAAAVLARMAPTLSGNGGKFLAVNSGASAVELVDAPAGGGGLTTAAIFTDSSDQTPSKTPRTLGIGAKVTEATDGILEFEIARYQNSSRDNGTTVHVSVAAYKAMAAETNIGQDAEEPKMVFPVAPQPYSPGYVLQVARKANNDALLLFAELAANASADGYSTPDSGIKYRITVRLVT